MDDIDFSECKLINELLCFLTYDEFCKNRKIIKKLFNELTKYGKMFYKYYVYANIHMSVVYKDRIWNYLNIDDISAEVELMRFKGEYKPKI